MTPAREAALRLLAARELCTAQLRSRLRARGHPPDEIAATIDELTRDGRLDDRRYAGAYIRTAILVKRRGRLRIQRELETLGVDAGIVRTALAEIFSAHDERQLVEDALNRRLGPLQLDRRERRRAYAALLRQGFAHDVIAAALRARGDTDDESS